MKLIKLFLSFVLFFIISEITILYGQVNIKITGFDLIQTQDEIDPTTGNTRQVDYYYVIANINGTPIVKNCNIEISGLNPDNDCRLQIRHHEKYFISPNVFTFIYNQTATADASGKATFTYNTGIYQSAGVMELTLTTPTSTQVLPQKFVPERVREGEFPGSSGYKYWIYYHDQAFFLSQFDRTVDAADSENIIYNVAEILQTTWQKMVNKE